MKQLILDPSASGATASKIAAALCQLARADKAILRVVHSICESLPGVWRLEVDLESVLVKDLEAKRLTLKASGAAAPQKLSKVLKSVKESEASSEAKAIIIEAYTLIAEARGRLLGRPSLQDRLGEEGKLSSVADIVAAAVAAARLGIRRNCSCVTLPPSLGAGVERRGRAITSIPGNLTLQILAQRRMAGIGGPSQRELTTPAGAALLASLADAYSTTLPFIKPLAMGYGVEDASGDGDAPFRAILGETTIQYPVDSVYLVETTVDDVTGEQLSYFADKVLEAGAGDIIILSGVGKRGRPAHALRALCEPANLNQVLETLFSEGATLGARIIPCERRKVPRDVTKVKLQLPSGTENVSIKVARDPRGRILRARPEFQEIRELAKKHRLPLAKVLDLINEATQRFLTGHEE